MRPPWPEKFLAKPRYRFPKWASAIVKNRKLTLTVLTLFYVFFILMGGIYDIVNKVPFVGYTTQGLTIVYQSLNHQFVAEGFIAAFLIFLGSLGLRLMQTSVKHIEDPNRSMVYSIAGFSLIIVSVALLEYMISIKT